MKTREKKIRLFDKTWKSKDFWLFIESKIQLIDDPDVQKAATRLYNHCQGHQQCRDLAIVLMGQA